jgi:hypothetical protein
MTILTVYCFFMITAKHLPWPMNYRRPSESDQLRFLRATCLPNLKGSVGLILAKESDMKLSIPFDLSSRPFIP